MNLHIDKLPSETAGLLIRLSEEKYMSRFSLVGGSALSLQLAHRQSEDLDFIFDSEKIDNQGIKRFVAKNFPTYRLIREETGYQLDFLIREVKLTFFSSGAVLLPFIVKNYTFPLGRLNITKAETIAVIKMGTIAQRCTIRDYYDLYYLSRFVLPLSEIFKNTRSLIPNLPPITYSETIIYTGDIPENSISDHLSPAITITKQEIADFFVEELKKMKSV
ncbi:MAG: nucleotidyl transferase AbiEii/AbiGii toxin family protein [Bacteroidetes bacterium]|nr:nucleotidyl transferase AbiEii/AbiGii toxin family protein [Bacteroidota bacterium]